ncbi:MAG: phosphate signaling complex protein PhoU [Verrucomicrobiales bacterium]
MPQHILHAFEDALNKLRQDIVTMASLTQHSLSKAVRGLLERNTDLCNQVIAEDDEVDRLEIQVDRDSLEVIMKFSPVATDLRRVLWTMKVGQQLERVADEAVNIARRARSMNQHPALPETGFIQPVYELASGMLRDAITAFVDGDLRMALAMEQRDEALDDAHAQLIQRLIKRSAEDADHIGDYVNTMFIVRFLERVGDHAVNIAEDIVYSESAYDIRHGGERPNLEAPERA